MSHYNYFKNHPNSKEELFKFQLVSYLCAHFRSGFRQKSDFCGPRERERESDKWRVPRLSKQVFEIARCQNERWPAQGGANRLKKGLKMDYTKNTSTVNCILASRARIIAEL